MNLISEKENRRGFILWMLILLLAGPTGSTIAQGTPTDHLPGDPGALSVYNVQNMAFGAFSHGVSGGTIVLSPTGTRTATGSVTALNLGVSYFQAIFDLAAPQGSIISIMNSPEATLTGSNGGSMTLQLGNTSPNTPFIIDSPSPTRTSINVGGTLTVGTASANPPGTYSGILYITFNQE